MVQVVTRAEWGATAPLGPAMRLPVAELWLHHSVSQLTDDPHADMRAIERIGVQRFGRYSYSWAYHPIARVLMEGAGNTVGAHTAGRNSTSLGLVLIGNYDTRPLTDDNIADLRWIIAWLIGGNRLRPGTYPTGGHRDLKATACPGALAYQRIADLRTPSTTPTPTPPRPEVVDVQLPVLRQGANGGAVKSLQALLNAKSGSRLAVDGDFGPATHQRVREVQAYCRLTVDGIVGAKTWGLLFL